MLQYHPEPYLELKLRYVGKFENNYQWAYPGSEYLQGQK